MNKSVEELNKEEKRALLLKTTYGRTMYNLGRWLGWGLIIAILSPIAGVICGAIVLGWRWGFSWL